MGKSNRALTKLLEAFLTFFFRMLQAPALVVFKFRKLKEKKTIPPTKNPILLISASELAQKIRRKEVKCKDVMEIFVSRIKETNLVLNFMVENRFSQAFAEAEIVDDFLKNTTLSEKELELAKPFLGVPFTVKESLAVEGLSHTAGLDSRKDIKAKEDAKIVSIFKKSGAIPICVTNTPELCCWIETYNWLHGCTENPYNTNFTPGGSSGGEAAAISSASSTFGLGTDFAGSIRIPASFCGVFGHKPSSGTVDIEGHYPIPANQKLQKLLVSGPICRYAKDLKPILRIITKEKAPDLDLESPVDFKKLKVYYLDEVPNMFLSTPVQPSIKAAISKTVRHFVSLGSKVECLRIKGMQHAVLYWFGKLKTADGPQIGIEVANRNGSVNMVVELLKYFFGASKHTLPIVLFGVLEEVNGVPYNGILHSSLMEQFQCFESELKKTLGDNAILILPTHPTVALRHKEPVARTFDLGFSAVINVLGFPATACPVGQDEKGLPVGVQVAANYRQDRLTLAAAEEIEKRFGGWVPPY